MIVERGKPAPTTSVARTSALLLLVAAFACTPSQDRTEEGIGVVQSIRYVNSTDTYVRLAPEVHMADVLDLSIFEGLEPGSTLEQAIAVLGEPSRVQGERATDSVFIFPRPQGRLEVVKRTVESEGDQSVRWVLRFVPKKIALAAYLSAEVAGQVSVGEGNVNLTVIAGRNSQERASLVLRLGEVKAINYLHGSK